MNNTIRKLAFVFLSLCLIYPVSSQGIKIKNNLLYDATLTPNLGLEFSLSSHNSVQVYYGFNPFTFSDNKKLQNWSVNPELRWWRKEVFDGWFLGADVFGGEFNMGGVKLPLGIWPSMEKHRYDGWFAGAGVGIGYVWNLSRRWSLEAATGVGYAYLDYDRYPCYVCGAIEKTRSRHYVGPTKAAISLAYTIRQRQATMPRTEMIEPTIIHDTVVTSPVVVHDTIIQLVKPEAPVLADINGSANIVFVLNETAINDDYLNNTRELRAISDTINYALSLPQCGSVNIEIHGYASPDGSYENNARLAEGRAQAVMERIRQSHNLPRESFSYTSTAENWEGLAEFVRHASFSEEVRRGILDIISEVTPDNADQSERQIQERYPEAFAQLKRDCYPFLRRTTYRILVRMKD